MKTNLGCLVVSLFLFCATAGLPENVIGNPGFETGQLSPWVSSAFGEQVKIVEGEGRSGKFALKITGNPESEINSGVVVVQNIKVIPEINKKYRITGYVKTNVVYVRNPSDGPGPRSAGFSVRQTAKGNTIAYNRIPLAEEINDSETTKWGGQKYELVFTLHPDATDFQIHILARNLRTSDYIIFDDFSFEEVK